MQRYLLDANVSDIDPAPHLRLIDGKAQHSMLSKRFDEIKDSKKNIFIMEQTFRQLKPRIELTDLETTKFVKSGESLKEKASQQLSFSQGLSNKVNGLERDITRIINELRNFDV